MSVAQGRVRPADTLPAAMTALRAAVFGLLGLAFGSFLSVVVHRVPRKESVVAPRSRCPTCGTELRARDNIPVVSYLLLRGRCRTCGARISPRYLLLEVATAGLFVGAALRFSELATAAMMALFFAVMVAVTAIDLELRIIPNRIVLPAIPAFAVLLALAFLVGDHLSLAEAGLGLLAYGGGLLLVALVVPGGMGMGDVKLAALIGLVLGSFGLDHVAVAAGAAVIGGGVGAAAALLFGGATRKTPLPFGPYLAAGAVVAAFAATEVARWYTARFV
jgi:leader peptidase (prepilin peptidase) / N-methyltransferase